MGARRKLLCLALLVVLAGAGAAQTPAAPPVTLPNQDGTFRFVAFGDFGTGARPQYELARQMALLHARWRFDVVTLLGDNLYGSEGPGDYQKKFEVPYKPLLDAEVTFHAALGNHDDRRQIQYPRFNMADKLHYSFAAPKQSVRFFVLDSNSLDALQLAWLRATLKVTSEDWRIAYFHHPMYSSGERHGSGLALREALEPIFIQYRVSVVLAGHDHVYERINPQQGITYFVVGSGGQLRKGNLDPKSGLTASGFDRDQAFLAAEIDGDQMFFNAISRTGVVVDSGIVRRR